MYAVLLTLFYSEQTELKSNAAEQLSRSTPIFRGGVVGRPVLKNMADRFLPPIDIVFERLIFAFPFKKKSNLQI